MRTSAIAAGLFATVLMLAACPAARAEKPRPDVVLAGHTGAVLDVAFSPDGKLVASVGDDGLLKVWDVAGRKERFSLPDAHTSRNNVRFTPDGKSVVTLGSDNTVWRVDAHSGKPGKPIALPNDPGGAKALDVSPDGKTVAIAGRGHVRLFDLADGSAKQTIDVHAGYEASAVTFSADGSALATAGSDNSATVISTATWRVTRKVELGLKGTAVALSRDGKTLFAASTDQVLRSFDVSNGESKTLVQRLLPLLSLVVSADGKTLVIGGPGRGPWLVALPDGTLLDPAHDGDSPVNSAAVSPDGKWLAGGAADGSVELWKLGGK